MRSTLGSFCLHRAALKRIWPQNQGNNWWASSRQGMWLVAGVVGDFNGVCGRNWGDTQPRREMEWPTSPRDWSKCAPTGRKGVGRWCLWPYPNNKNNDELTQMHATAVSKYQRFRRMQSDGILFHTLTSPSPWCFAFPPTPSLAQYTVATRYLVSRFHSK